MTTARVVRPTGRDPDPEGRAAFREFVRRHHPDVGGDPAVFLAGLRAFRDGSSGPGVADTDRADRIRADRIRADRIRADRIRADRIRADPRDDDPRVDAPIVAVSGRPIPRIGRLGRRLLRKYDPRPGSARVI